MLTVLKRETLKDSKSEVYEPLNENLFEAIFEDTYQE